MAIFTDPKHVEEMTSYMKQQNFSPGYVAQHVQVFQFIIKRISLYNWQNYDDVRKWVSSQNYNGTYKERLLRVVSDIEYFCLFNRFPNDRNYGDYLPPFIPDPDMLSSFLHQQGFCETYITRHIRVVKSIIRDTPKYSWNNMANVKEWYSKRGLSASSLADVIKILSNIEYFHSHGTLRGNCEMQRAFNDTLPSKGSLDLSFWNDHLEELLSFMHDNDYSEAHIQMITFICRRIAVLSRTLVWESYEEILLWYQSQELTDSYLMNIRCALGILEAFHMRGEFPNNRNTQSNLCPRDNSFSKLNTFFRDMVLTEIDLCKSRGLRESSIESCKSVLSVFLYGMQSAGAETINDITEEMVSSYFHKLLLDGTYQSVPNKLLTVLSDLSDRYPQCFALKLQIPKIHSGRKNIQYLTAEEAAAFEATILDQNSKITLKSRAIGTILFYTGIRSVDIANLQLDSIDLRNSTINFMQRKTLKAVSIPLLPVVGNAIVDYCRKERPSADNNYLFVGNHAPHHPIGSGAIYIAVESVMKEAGIRRNKGDRRGAHIFRHHFATSLLENNVAPTIITAALGHASPVSLNAYLYSDMVHLKECALSISNFPIREEVFQHV